MKIIKSIMLSLTLFQLANFSYTSPLTSQASFEVGFSPYGNSLELILKGIDNAKNTIEVAAYTFTSKPIAIALVNAAKRGVKVRVVADSKSNMGKYSALTFLQHHNVPVRLNNHYSIFHHKFIIIDNQNVETGSFNFSSSAVKRNAENVLLLTNVPKLAIEYEKEWNRLWNEASI